MKVIYSLHELEQLLAKETASRLGYTGEETPAFQAQAVTVNDDEETPAIIISMAVPEQSAGNPIVQPAQIETVTDASTKARGGRRAGAGRKKAGGKGKK